MTKLRTGQMWRSLKTGRIIIVDRILSRTRFADGTVVWRSPVTGRRGVMYIKNLHDKYEIVNAG